MLRPESPPPRSRPRPRSAVPADPPSPSATRGTTASSAAPRASSEPRRAGSARGHDTLERRAAPGSARRRARPRSPRRRPQHLDRSRARSRSPLRRPPRRPARATALLGLPGRRLPEFAVVDPRDHLVAADLVTDVHQELTQLAADLKRDGDLRRRLQRSAEGPAAHHRSPPARPPRGSEASGGGWRPVRRRSPRRGDRAPGRDPG